MCGDRPHQIKSGHVTNTHWAAIGAQVATATGPGGTPAGVGIIAVTYGGPADRAVLRLGDVIQAVGQVRTPDIAALAQALAAAHPGQAITVTIARDAQTLTVHVTLAKLPGG